MKQADVFILHGIGEHPENWSLPLQGELTNRLTAVGLQPTFYEPNYCHIVEARASVQSTDDAVSTPEEIAIEKDRARMEVAIDTYLGPEDEEGATVAVQGMSSDARQILRDLTDYAIRYLRESALREAVDTCVLNAIHPVSQNARKAGRELILIGHSLGSVILWNILQDSDSDVSHAVSRLVTLGSPLGWLKLARIVHPETVKPRWVNAGTPGDIVCAKPISEPPFTAEGGLVSIWTRRHEDAHSAIWNDPKIVSDWAPMLA